MTRDIVKNIHDGSLAKEEFNTCKLLNMEMQTPKKYQHPRHSWKNGEEYDATLAKLERLFDSNYNKYE